MSSVWDDLRKDFPALERQTYLNAAATSPIPRPVHDAAVAFYREIKEGGRPSLGRLARDR